MTKVALKRWMLRPIAHCSEGCQPQSWVRRETTRSWARL
jgi:hypothetical protein